MDVFSFLKSKSAFSCDLSFFKGENGSALTMSLKTVATVTYFALMETHYSVREVFFFPLLTFFVFCRKPQTGLSSKCTSCVIITDDV